MSPAVLRRIEHESSEEGWAGVSSQLDCCHMPTPYADEGFYAPHEAPIRFWGRHFGWTGQSLETWVTRCDRRVLDREGYVLRYYFCPPGTFHIGHEQVVFDKQAAVVVGEESLV